MVSDVQGGGGFRESGASGQGLRKGGFGVSFAGRTGLCKTHMQHEDMQGMLTLGSKARECTQEHPEDGKTSLNLKKTASVECYTMQQTLKICVSACQGRRVLCSPVCSCPPLRSVCGSW